MSEGQMIGVNGSIQNRVATSNIKEEYPIPDNIQLLSFDCWTKQQIDLINTNSNLVHPITISDYGTAGMGLRAQRCMSSLKTSIQNAIISAEETAKRNNYPLKFYSTLMLPTGSCSVGSVISSYIAKEEFGAHTFLHAVIPDILACENYQTINAIYNTAVASFQPLVLLPENFATIPADVKSRAQTAANGRASNFHVLSQFFLELFFKLSKLIGGLTEAEPEQEKDDLSFLNVEEGIVRNQSCELEAAIAGRQELFTIHYSPCFSKKCNWEKIATITPMIQPVEPRDVIALVEYDHLKYSEDDIQNHLKSSFNRQELAIERFLYLPSNFNSVTVWIPSEVPASFIQLVKYVKGNKNLNDILEVWLRKAVLSSLPPILKGREKKILKQRMGQIFLQDKFELEELAKAKFAMSYDELVKRNILFWLGENEGVYLRPIGGM